MYKTAKFTHPFVFYHSIMAEIDKDLSNDKISPATVFMRTKEGEERIEPHDGKHDKNDYIDNISFLSFLFRFITMQNCVVKHQYVCYPRQNFAGRELI